MFGEKIRELREAKGLLQRQVAAELDVDTAYVSKLEKNTKLVKRSSLKKLANLMDYSEDDLLTLWLAHKLYKLIKDEAVALKALEITQIAVVNTTIRQIGHPKK